VRNVRNKSYIGWLKRLWIILSAVFLDKVDETVYETEMSVLNIDPRSPLLYLGNWGKTIFYIFVAFKLILLFVLIYELVYKLRMYERCSESNFQ
jgi:hypothetical protein